MRPYSLCSCLRESERKRKGEHVFESVCVCVQVHAKILRKSERVKNEQRYQGEDHGGNRHAKYAWLVSLSRLKCDVSPSSLLSTVFLFECIVLSYFFFRQVYIKWMYKYIYFIKILCTEHCCGVLKMHWMGLPHRGESTILNKCFLKKTETAGEAVSALNRSKKV